MGSTRKQVHLFRRYLWLYECITSHGPITFEGICERWDRSSLSGGDALPHKTFENHRQAVQELFDVEISCNRSNNTYYISDTYPDGSTRIRHLFNSAVILNDAIARSGHLADCIDMESIEGDLDYLHTILRALDNGRMLHMRYRHNYNPDKEEDVTVNPIGLKLFRQRWYMVAQLPDKTTYSYPLDRIQSLTTGEPASRPHIRLEKLFADCFGIIRQDEVPPQTIMLRVEREQANYLKALPLHKSQKYITTDGDYEILQLRVCPTYDFIMQILSYGETVEVLSPHSLRQTIADRVAKLSKLYL